jgi:hypothetical protein
MEAALIKDYGTNYMDAFNNAVAVIQQWDSANA